MLRTENENPRGIWRSGRPRTPNTSRIIGFPAGFIVLDAPRRSGTLQGAPKPPKKLQLQNGSKPTNLSSTWSIFWQGDQEHFRDAFETSKSHPETNFITGQTFYRCSNSVSIKQCFLDRATPFVPPNRKIKSCSTFINKVIRSLHRKYKCT